LSITLFKKAKKIRKKAVSHKILWDIAIKIKFYGTLPKNMGFMGLSSKYGTKIKFYGTWQVCR
jgi:biotin synthase-like enzyme